MALVLALALGLAYATGARADLTALDHLKCYKIKDSAEKATYTADLTAGFTDFPNDTGCQVKVPAKLLCNVVSKENVSPAPPGAPFGQFLDQLVLCYKLKCPKGELEHNVEDQFGERIMSVGSSKLLCTPATPNNPV
jgi:hypothetical protein